MSVFWQKDILYLNSDFKCHIIFLTIFENIPQISTIQLVRFYLQLLIRTAGKVPQGVKFLEAKIFPRNDIIWITKTKFDREVFFKLFE